MPRSRAWRPLTAESMSRVIWTFWHAVSESSRLWAWKMNPMLRRTSIIVFAPAPRNSWFRMRRLPSCTVRRAPIRVRRVVFPEPEGPVLMTISPGSISAEMSNRTCFRSCPSPK